MAHDDSGSTDKKPAHPVADATANDLLPVGQPRTDATQLIDPLAASSPKLLETDTDALPVGTTDRGLPTVAPTTTDLPPVVSTSTDLPPVPATSTDLPPVPSSGLPPVDATNEDLPPVPSASELTRPRPDLNAVTAPRLAKRKASKAPGPPPFGLTPPRLVAIGVGVAVLFVLLWLVWPLLTRPAKPQPIEWVDGPPTTQTPVAADPSPRPASPPKPKAPAPAPAGQFTLDARRHVIDPRALHAPDVPLEPTHKYRLTLKAEDPKAGSVLARLEEKAGWGVLHRMATHHALQFGGARTLRLHCEPGTDVRTDTAIALELEDLARKAKRKTLTVSPLTECYDFELGRLLELEPGQTRRVLLRSEQTAKLGEQTPLKVVYRLPFGTEPGRWRFGVLGPGDDVLAGPGARFAILDPYLGDNEGEVALQLLPGDTDSKGLVRPESSDSKYVPNRP
ncbi:MAG: hypothetical protein AMXMBFR34_30520 [Myxococcaceae bacterium]